MGGRKRAALVFGLLSHVEGNDPLKIDVRDYGCLVVAGVYEVPDKAENGWWQGRRGTGLDGFLADGIWDTGLAEVTPTPQRRYARCSTQTVKHIFL